MPYFDQTARFGKIPVVGFVAEKSATSPGAPVTGQLWYDTTNNRLWVCTNATTPVWAPATLVDGDKGDITVSNNGVNWTIDASAVTSAKIADGTIQAGDLAPGVIPTTLPPSGAAGGDLTGSYPNPTIGTLRLTNGYSVTDANSATTAGWWYSSVGTTNIPAGASGYGVGLTIVRNTPISGLGQIYWEVAGTPGVVSTRTNDGGTWTAWRRVVSGGDAAGGDLTGTYPNPTIANNKVTYAKIQAVAASRLLGNPLGSASVVSEIGLGSDHEWMATTFQLGAFTGDITKAAGSLATVIANNAVTSAKIADGTIVAGDLAPGTIPTTLPGPPTGAAGGVLTGTYPSPGLATNSVAGSNLMDSAVGTAKLASGAVDQNALASGSVTSSKIVDGTIQSNDLAPGVIPTTLPPTGTAGGDLTGTYPNPDIGAGKVGNAELAANAVTTDKIADGTIVWQDLSSGLGATLSDLALNVLDEGTLVRQNTDILDFRGPGVTAAGDGTVTIPGAMFARVCDNSTSNPVGAAPATVDTVALAVGNRVLRVGTGGAATNGLWVVQTVGTGANGTWVRAPDADTSAKLAGQAVAVQEGNAYGGSRWRTSFKGSDTLGTTAMWWFYSSQDLAAVHTFGDESVGGVKKFTDPLWLEEEAVSPVAPLDGARLFTRAGKVWVKTPTTEYALGVESTAVSLLTNGDFETRKGAVGSEPTGWNGFWHAGASTAIQATDDAATGLGSAKCHINAVAGENINLQTDDAFPVTPGGVLNLEFNAKSGPQAGAQISIELQTSVDNTGGAPNFFVTGTTTTSGGVVIPVNGWTHYVKQIVIPAGHTLARLALRVMKNTSVVGNDTTAQDIWIDSCVAQMSTAVTDTLEWRSVGLSSAVGFPAGTKVIPFNKDDGGTGITLNASGQLVIQTPGTYHAVVGVEVTNGSAATYMDLNLNQWRAGSRIAYRNTVQYATGWMSAAISGDFTCLAGDIFEVTLAPGAANVLTAESNRSQFTIHKLAGPGAVGPSGVKGDKGDVGYADMSVRLVCRVADFNPATNAPLAVDGVNVIAGDRVLKVSSVPQAGSTFDGIYQVVTPGTGSNGVWTRATDADTNIELYAANVKVGEGNIWGGTRWSNSLRSNSVLTSTFPRWACFSGDTGWIDCVLQGTTAQYPGYDTCQYRRLNGIVYTKGLATITAASQVLFTYPVGFRPGATGNGIQHVATSMQGTWGVVNVLSTGEFRHNAGTIGWVSLQIPPFPADG